MNDPLKDALHMVRDIVVKWRAAQDKADAMHDKGTPRSFARQAGAADAACLALEELVDAALGDAVWEDKSKMNAEFDQLMLLYQERGDALRKIREAVEAYHCYNGLTSPNYLNKATSGDLLSRTIEEILGNVLGDTPREDDDAVVGK